jgi:NAD+ synthase
LEETHQTLHKTTHELCNKAKTYLYEIAGKESAVIGLGGGVDSSVTTYLSCKSIGNKNTYVMLLPSQSTPKQDLEDAYSVIEILGILKENVVFINIDDYVNSIVKALGSNLDKVSVGNIKARIRMIL